ncbi:MAG: hypothetical protein ACRCYO_07280 [Bacteroidia bacterium]
MNFAHKLFFSGLLLATLSACKPEPVFPIEPSLVFKEYIQSQTSDSLQVVFTFTDGDGDIGIAPGDADTNMLLTAYYRNALGEYIVYPNFNTVNNPFDSLVYPYRVPRLTASQKGVEGDIYVVINEAFISYYDTIAFNAFIVDQAGHKSQIVRTPELILR